MYTVILFAVIGIVFVWYNEIRDGLDFFWDTVGYSILAGILGAFIGLVVAAILPQSYKTDKWSENLYTLQDNPSISGSFFLGSGQIGGVMKYVFYVNRNETYEMWTVDYYNASIKYSTTPKANITSTHPSKSLWNKFAIGFFDNKEKWTCVFEVPKGSIKNNFELDAK